MRTDAADPPTTSVLVVDDHTTFSELLSLALGLEPDFTCVGTASSIARAHVMVNELRPDLVLMDVRLGDGDGVAASAELTQRHPDLRVIVLTAHTDSSVMQRAVDAGVCGFLPKDGSLPELLHALRSAHRGGLIVHHSLLKALVAQRPRRKSDALSPLTRREQQVLKMLADGSDVRTLAKSLKISVNTARGYVKTLLMKLDAHSQLEAVVIATKHGMVNVAPGLIPGGLDRRKGA